MTPLPNNPIFAGIPANELDALLQKQGFIQRKYSTDEVILAMGEKPVHMGILLAGTAQVVQDDAYGNRTIVTTLKSGDVFGEAYVLAEVLLRSVGVMATSGCTVLLFPRPSDTRLIQNLLRMQARKAILLQNRLETLSRRTTREKLLAYLQGVAAQAGSQSFAIPLNRQQLADYLCVDRSAMSAELSQMQREGLVAYHKNHFQLPERTP